MNNIVLNEELRIEDMIYEVRGVQIMIDSNLAKIYQVETKKINEAIKNNLEKFLERFSWVLTKNDTPGKGHHRKYLPRVFTE